MESIVSHTVSHYEFLEKLGAGGMGEIYKARDSRLNRVVAVKVLAPGSTRDPERRRRFIQEAQAASALNHPNIITIHDILPESDTQYMVMEFVAGKTLQELIAAARLEVPQTLQIATQMANALATAHAAGIIHRDLKPANVMVTNSGLVKVLDFGLAKLMDPTARVRSSAGNSTVDPLTLTAVPLTAEGAIMGTVNYMSPEQAEGLRVDARSDIFSFGAVLYEMVTGQRAFNGESPISTLSAVLRDEVRPIREVAAEAPPELNDLIARCLRKNPGERWQSMTEVAAALHSLRVRQDSGLLLHPAAAPASGETPAVPRTRSPKRARRLVLIGATVVVLAACAIGGAWWQTHRQAAAAPSKPPATVANNVAPAPQPAPPSAPPSEPETKTDAANAIPSAGAPPPSNPAIPLVNNLKTPVLPSPVTATSPRQPQAANPAPAVAVAPVPHAPAPPEIVPVTLGDGVPFRIALLDDVPLDAELGHAVRFRVLEGLRSGDAVVIAKGAIVTGSVAALGGKRRFFGERSKVRFRLLSAASVDDNAINVRATPAPKTGGDETRPFETPKSSKDSGAIATSGTEYVAYVAGDQTVNVHK